jgi:hypothetical protein
MRCSLKILDNLTRGAKGPDVCSERHGLSISMGRKALAEATD